MRNALRWCRKTLFLGLSLVVCAGIFTVLAGCDGGLSDSDKQFVKKVQEGIQERFDIEDKCGDSFEEGRGLIKKGIDAEIGVISDFDLSTIEDEELAELADRYMKSLESEKKGIGFVLKDARKANKYYIDEGVNVRSDCLLRLNDSYGLEVDSAYSDQFEESLEKSEVRLFDLGETVKAVSDSGAINLSFDKYVIDANYNSEFDDGKCGILLCRAENISFDGTEYEEKPGSEYVPLDSFFAVTDGAGVNVSFSEYGDSYRDYGSCPGAYGDLPKGHKKKLAIRCHYAKKNQYLEIAVPGEELTYCCYLKVG